MNEQPQVPETTTAPEAAPTISAATAMACDVATGKTPADAGAAGTAVIGAKKDLNSRGHGPEWYRMVYRGVWRYVSDDRLPRCNFLAADRRAEVYGDVYPGEIVVRHDRGSSVDAAWLVRSQDSKGKVLLPIDYRTRRDGQLAFTLPNGAEVVLPNPRGK